jgi:hypothetical protein
MLKKQAAPLLQLARLLTITFAVCYYCMAQSASLSLSSGSATPGSTVALNLSLNATKPQRSGL